ncbi:MAG TPA: hypothetical protein PKH97_02895 [Tetrasphaera sp.]|uniref:hypothetical protein n=1 Tax=Nostocoides sp. TaxID=1917966 RepID=UPI002B90F13A|nr:hypothetical protein [Tetrasphaera sp.]HNQ06116.1 hypothetical protein [Tetrasphaera sp.]
MQGSVHRYDIETGDGSVLLDDGRELPFPGAALDGSGLRHLRVGQRVSLGVAGPGTERPEITRVWIVGIGDEESIR